MALKAEATITQRMAKQPIYIALCILALMGIALAGTPMWGQNGINATSTRNLYGNTMVTLTSTNTTTALCHQETAETGTSTQTTNQYAWGNKMTLPYNTSITLTPKPGNNLIYCTDTNMTTMLTPASNINGYPENPFIMLAVIAGTLLTLSMLFSKKNVLLFMTCGVGTTLLALLTIPESLLTELVIWLPGIVIADIAFGMVLDALNSMKTRKIRW